MEGEMLISYFERMGYQEKNILVSNEDWSLKRWHSKSFSKCCDFQDEIIISNWLGY
jgi:hypothetical protein